MATEGKDQNQVSAQLTVADGCPVLPKMQCHEVQMGQDARLLWNMRDTQGEVVDLSSFVDSCDSADSQTEETFDVVSTPSCGIELRLRELTGYDTTDKVHVVDVEIVTASEGLVKAASLPDDVVRHAGVYVEEWGAFTSDSRMLFSNQCCTFVRRGLFGLSNNPNQRNLGPPTIEEIRLSLRDNSPEDNFLLQDVEFDAAEITQAVMRPLQFWNETPPPLRPPQTTKTFPFREMWLLGIQAYLLDIAANNYRRNHLPYNAGGVAIDDKNKEQPYALAGQRLMKQFQDMVHAKKVEINIASFYGNVGSAYGG